MKKNSHEYFLKLSVDLAVKGAEKGGGPFGCVIVQGGKVIAKGMNKVQRLNDPTAHAELIAIRAACKKLKHYELKNCTIYSSSYPCILCLGAMYWARPKEIYYHYSLMEASRFGFKDENYYQDFQREESKRKYPPFYLDFNVEQNPFEVWNANPKAKLY